MNFFTAKIALGIGALIALWLYKSRSHNKDYNNEQNEHPEDEPRPALCSVCLNDFHNFSRRLNLPCGHPIHRDCGELLFVQRENSCTWCRSKISPEFLRAHFDKNEESYFSHRSI